MADEVVMHPFICTRLREPSFAPEGGDRGGIHLLLPVDASKHLRISTSTLAKWRVYGSGPLFVRLSGNRIAYREADISAWVAGRAVASTAERCTYSAPP